jgi:hypothetical protein
MAKVKTGELTGPALDWAVQEIEYRRMVAEGEHVKQWALDDHRAGASINHYSTDWLWGGSILEREQISVDFDADPECGGPCAASTRDSHCYWVGPTPLIAAMRCFCCSKLGDEVEVPDELL